MESEAVKRRTDWLMARAQANQRHGDPVLGAELAETAGMIECLHDGFQLAMKAGSLEAAQKVLGNILALIDNRAKR